MRKCILAALAGIVGIVPGIRGNAQVFKAAKDTVSMSFAKTSTMNDMLTNLTADNRVILWHVVDADFPADWLTGPAFGICDNISCLSNLGNSLWDHDAKTGETNKSIYYTNATHDSAGSFGLSMDLTKATTTGSHWMKVNVTDSATGQSKDLVFIINKLVDAVPSVTADSRIALYPNPAGNMLNVKNTGAAIRSVNIYNVAGIMVGTYTATGSSMTIDISALVPGSYTARFAGADGEAISRSFIKQ